MTFLNYLILCNVLKIKEIAIGCLVVFFVFCSRFFVEKRIFSNKL